jgi:hypothetical protein
MKRSDSKLARLLRSAALTTDQAPAATPFGFETRVVALWRAGTVNGGSNGILRLVRRVALVAGCVIVVSGAASFRELRATQDIVEPGANEYVIADSAIQNEFDQ